MDLDAFGRGCFLNKVWVIPNHLDWFWGLIEESIGAKGWKAGLIVGNGGDEVNKVGLCLFNSTCSSSVFSFRISFSFLSKSGP